MFIIHFIYFPEQQTLLPPHILCVVFIFITCSFIEDNNTRQSNDFAVGVCGPVGVLVSVSVHELVPYLLLLLFAAAAAAATLLIFRCSFSVRFLCTRSVHSLTLSAVCQCGSQLCVKFQYTSNSLCIISRSSFTHRMSR